MSQTTAPKLKTSAMIASFADPGQKTTPAPFGHALVRAAEQDSRIVGLSADLAKYTDMHIFAEAMPDRFFQIGMAEQLLLGAAAGMAEAGPQTGAGAGAETGPARGRRRTGAQNGAPEGTSESDGPGQ